MFKIFLRDNGGMLIASVPQKNTAEHLGLGRALHCKQEIQESTAVWLSKPIFGRKEYITSHYVNFFQSVYIFSTEVILFI